MVTLVDLEKHPEACIGFATRERRCALKPEMLARVVVIDGTRKERRWIRISSVVELGTEDGGPRSRGVSYGGKFVDDGHLVEIGEAIVFGPEHVCEWDVDGVGKPRGTTRKAATR